VLIDESSIATNTYEFALIQLDNFNTLEVYNIGIILKDTSNSNFIIPKIETSLDACLEIDEKSGINYTLDLIKRRIENHGHIDEGNVSNAIKIASYRPLTTSLGFEDTLEKLKNEYISLKKLRAVKKTARSKYEKLSIINELKQEVFKSDVRNVTFRHRYDFAHKLVDASHAPNGKIITSIAEISSLFVDGFKKNFMESAFVMIEANAIDTITNKFIYVPKMEDVLNKIQSKNMGWAKEMAKEIKVDLFTENSNEAFIERLTETV